MIVQSLLHAVAGFATARRRPCPRGDRHVGGPGAYSVENVRNARAVTAAARDRDRTLLRYGRALEALTLAWNVVGVLVLAVAAVQARSVALAGFGLDSLIEIGASTVVLWELSAHGEERQRRALRLIAGAFLALAVYITTQAVAVLATRHHPAPSPAGIAWTALTAAVMFVLAAGKRSAGRGLANAVLVAESRVTVVDGLLATAVLLGLALNAAAGWWWADPVAGLVLVYYALREVRTIHNER
jgi:divalent metal cation (Fe/Co/Zn/Cd) transporter